MHFYALAQVSGLKTFEAFVHSYGINTGPSAWDEQVWSLTFTKFTEALTRVATVLKLGERALEPQLSDMPSYVRKVCTYQVGGPWVSC